MTICPSRLPRPWVTTIVPCLGTTGAIVTRRTISQRNVCDDDDDENTGSTESPYQRIADEEQTEYLAEHHDHDQSDTFASAGTTGSVKMRRAAPTGPDTVDM